MAFSEIALKRIEKDVQAFMVKRRPAAPIRPQLDLEHRVTGKSVELFEIRPRWNAPDELLELPFASHFDFQITNYS
ncbi:conserved hypothetical protein [Luminiphilus syltensis NOR5-1B]|uniref:Uncharacterized protein n=1 Tax=Luminiphilus syltensis NOR5-1B TaxID=565045 RepID=B8KV20_9GAMM|nr:hypothetical protein [Luminiphilus syltensis]EED36327.1 conserved hypothetical protein [Luminiphilus syltensis NOR5-1B]